MKQDLRAGHGGHAVQLRVPPVPADDQRAATPSISNSDSLFAAAAVLLLVAAGHVDLRVLVDDRALRVDDVGEVQEPVGASS